MMTRRRFMIAGGGAMLLAGGIIGAKSAASLQVEFAEAIEAIEAGSGGRLGVAVLDTSSRQRLGWRGEERFAMCSTFKFLLAAAVLAKVDKGEERLERGIPVTVADIVSHSPVTKGFVGREATVAELCEAAMIVSDNGAANLLLSSIGGPEGLTRFARAIGDGVTRLDRTEPGLNEAAPGDPRDTTSPNAMLDDLDRLVLGTALSAGSRDRLTGWLVANRTGDKRLRAGLPQAWRAGDKTGTGERGTANDIGVFWPSRADPVLVTSYLTECPLDREHQNVIHADVARAVVRTLAREAEARQGLRWLPILRDRR